MELRIILLPYCLLKQPDGLYLILNRRYKPLGFNTGEWLNYEDYPIALKLWIRGVTAAKLSCQGDPSTDRIFLYNDSCIPTSSAQFMNAYLERLKLLAKLEYRTHDHPKVWRGGKLVFY